MSAGRWEASYLAGRAPVPDLVAAGDVRQGAERHFDIVGKAVNELFTMPWDGFQLSAELRVLLEAELERDASQQAHDDAGYDVANPQCRGILLVGLLTRERMD